MGAFGWPHLLIILAVILLLFGAAKLPALAKSLGQSARVFKGEMKAMKNDDASDETNKDAAAPQQSVAPETTGTARDSDPGQPPRSA
jgi:sec-independent protein translocase protein TatA